MNVVFILVFFFNIFSSIMMFFELKKRYAKYGDFYNKNKNYSAEELVNHKKTMKILIFIGASDGIMFWGVIISLIVGLLATDFQRFLEGLYISTTIAFLPSALGLLYIYQLNRKAD